MLFTVNVHGSLISTSSDPAGLLEAAVARAFPGSAVTVSLELPEPESRESILRSLTIVLAVGPVSSDEEDPEGDEVMDAGDVDFRDMEAAG